MFRSGLLAKTGFVFLAFGFSAEAFAIKFISPVTGTGCSISSTPGWRKHPITGRRDNHGAYDFPAVPKGSKLMARAAAAGTVTQVGFESGCGNYIEIQHAANLFTQYCHLKSRPNFSVGRKVSAGQILGQAGRTGQATGVHLHFETKTKSGWDASSHFDPVPKYISSRAAFGCNAKSGSRAQDAGGRD